MTKHSDGDNLSFAAKTASGQIWAEMLVLGDKDVEPIDQMNLMARIIDEHMTPARPVEPGEAPLKTAQAILDADLPGLTFAGNLPIVAQIISEHTRPILSPETARALVEAGNAIHEGHNDRTVPTTGIPCSCFFCKALTQAKKEMGEH